MAVNTIEAVAAVPLVKNHGASGTSADGEQCQRRHGGHPWRAEFVAVQAEQRAGEVEEAGPRRGAVRWRRAAWSLVPNPSSSSFGQLGEDQLRVAPHQRLQLGEDALVELTRLRTLTHSPSAIENAPMIRLANPASRTAPWPALEALG